MSGKVFARPSFMLKAALLLMLAVYAQWACADLQLQRDYVRVQPPQRTHDPKKIEVIEFFSYGCPHCNEMHPVLDRWLATLPKDVEFIRIPVEFGHEDWGVLAKTYYTLQLSGDLARLDGAVFSAIHEQHEHLIDEAKVTAWAGAHGIDRKKFAATFNSFSVATKKAQADKLAMSYAVEGVPTFIVDGKYQLVGENARSYADWMPLLNQLIVMARKEKR